MPKEYIEREALLQRIDDEFDLQYGEIEINPRDFYEMVEDAPAADVVEVVRCKDCKHKVNFQNRIMCDRNARCSSDGSEWYGLTATNNDNFCSYGERKEEEN